MGGGTLWSCVASLRFFVGGGGGGGELVLFSLALQELRYYF